MTRNLPPGFCSPRGSSPAATIWCALSLARFAREGNVVNVLLADQATVDFERLTRHVFASSSCGVCGKATIDAIHQDSTRSRVTFGSIPAFCSRFRTGSARPKDVRTNRRASCGRDLHRLRRADHHPRRRRSTQRGGQGARLGLLHGLLPFDRHVLMVSGRACI